MKAVVVCVDFADYLAITLPKNVKQFDEVLVVTSDPCEDKTIDLAVKNGVGWRATDAFYRNGTEFNKGAAIEEAFDVLGREGWFCLLDADIILPESFSTGRMKFRAGRENWMLFFRSLSGPTRPVSGWGVMRMASDHIWSARRRTAMPEDGLFESRWPYCPPWPDSTMGGYFLMFHSDALGDQRPWYPTNWRHAGGADTEFVEKWPEEKRHYLPFEVLHLGKPCRNWFGRIASHLDGTEPTTKEGASAAMAEMQRQRNVNGDYRWEKMS